MSPNTLMSLCPEDITQIVSLLQTEITKTLTPPLTPPLITPSVPTLTTAKASLTTLPTHGLGATKTLSHLLTDILPGLTAQSTTHYYGFITGGVTPAALAADILVTLTDQNVQVHLPTTSISTTLEVSALEMLLQLFRLDPPEWRGRTFTTGATASNILGLACAREHLLQEKLKIMGYTAEEASVGELGILGACVEAGVMGIQILTAAAHSSVSKAAAVIGIGRRNIHDVSCVDAPWEFDLEALERRLEDAGRRGIVSVVVVGFGEVNTGMFTRKITAIRDLATKHCAWLHVDAAFGIFARVLSGGGGEMGLAGHLADGLELADSITGDAHKLLNVPYDCGFFFTRDPTLLSHTFINTAPYLSTPTSTSTVPSPLNLGLENSRRFRALPVYATLCAYGTEGYKDLVERLITHARAIAGFLYDHEGYELLPEAGGEAAGTRAAAVERVFMVVLFRAKEDRVNVGLRERINADGRVWVSGTVWAGREAVRLAVGNWGVERQVEIVEEVLDGAVRV